MEEVNKCKNRERDNSLESEKVDEWEVNNWQGKTAKSYLLVEKPKKQHSLYPIIIKNLRDWQDR